MNHAVVTACSSGAHAIGDAARLIQWGDAEVMIAGGAEAAICRLGVAGFAQAKALSTNNDTPERALVRGIRTVTALSLARALVFWFWRSGSMRESGAQIFMQR